MHTPSQLQTASAIHPRLHFSADDLAALRQRAQTSHAGYARQLFDWVDTHADWSPQTTYPFAGSRTTEVALEESGAFLTNAALAAVLSEQPRYRDLAVRWALLLCAVPPGAPNNYGFGPYVAGLARAYDWLYDEFEPAARERLRDHISHITHGLYLASFRNRPETQWWAECYLHHDHWVPTGGYGEAALALGGEVADAETWALRAMQEFSSAFAWLGDDGAWQEGAADWCYALAPLLWFFGAWQSVTGDNPHDLPWLRATSLYRLYHWLPDDTYIYSNDSFRSGRYNTSGSASCYLLRRLAALFHDGHAQWLAERDEAFDLKPGPKGVTEAAYEGSSLARGWQEYPHPQAICAAWNVLWFNPSVAAVVPDDLPHARHFENQGVSILRSGWDADATVVSFACGPLSGQRVAERITAGEERQPINFTHCHADYGAFTLFTGGRYAIVPPGYARRDSRFQNTISINGAHMLPNPDRQPRILACASEPAYSYSVGDATDVFPDHLDVRRFHRHLLLLGSDWLIMFDDVRLGNVALRSWNRFEWAVHSDPHTCELEVAHTGANWRDAQTDGDAILHMQVLEPAAFIWERSTLSATNGANLLEALRLSVPEWYQPSMHVLTAWNCTGAALAAERLEASGCSALSVEAGGQRWVIVFRHEQPQQPGALLSYRCAAAHRLIMLGLPTELAHVGIERAGETVALVLTGALPVLPDGRVETIVDAV